MNPASILLSITIVAILAWIFLPGYRLRLVLAKPFPPAYSRILRKNLPMYSRMPTDLQMQLKRRIKQFLYQKKFVGCDGLAITQEMKVTIAARACLLLLNRNRDVFPDLHTILVYPTAFIAPRKEVAIGGVVTHTNQTLSGESWSDGRVILGWDHVLHAQDIMGEGHDVVIHEFAHQLDSESGSTNGAPVMASTRQYQRWSKVMHREFAQLQHERDMGHHGVIDHYGATNPAEFFAVVSETFFLKSTALALSHPELFDAFRAYYKVDPRDWI
jgi:hypothetical protein